MSDAGRSWKKPDRVPSPGDRVRVIVFGDDYHREGIVDSVVGGYLFIDFFFKWERLHTADVEVWS